MDYKIWLLLFPILQFGATATTNKGGIQDPALSANRSLICNHPEQIWLTVKGLALNLSGKAKNMPQADTILPPLSIPPRLPNAEPGSAFMDRISSLTLEEREEEIYRTLAAGNLPDFLRQPVRLKAEFADSTGVTHTLQYEVLPDYLAVGSDEDYCRIPMNPHTAQRLANLFGASLITAQLSDHIYSEAETRLEPFFYKPVGNANETVEKFVIHNTQIEKQKAAAGGINGQLIAGIKKDVILSERIAQRTDRVVIYGWHKPDEQPIQPVYSGHIDWYVDYSHGIRLMKDQVLLDGKPLSVSVILTDPILYKVLSNESQPMKRGFYTLK